MGELLQFPVRKQSCFDCEHYLWNPFGNGRCLLFDEEIDSELHAAQDCAGFEHS